MNFHVTETLDATPLTAPATLPRLAKIGRAVDILKLGRRQHQLPSLLFQMLKLLYKSEGYPVVGTYEGRKALIFDGKADTDEHYEYPVLLLDSDGSYRVYSLKKRPGQQPWTYFAETLTAHDWVPQKLYID